MPNEPMLVTVSQLNRKIGNMFAAEKTFEDIRIRGEISDLRRNAKSGHYYFTLKDESASVSAVIYKFNAEAAEGLEDGMEIIARGSVSVYQPYGIYQLKVFSVADAKAGAMSSAFEKLKEKLAAEHLFDRKRPLPESPERICVITSETGAVLQDIRNVLSRRCPQVKVTLIPAVVQGDKAPASIVSAFGIAAGLDCDVIIFGRGGGSSEDLSAFNDEAVVRAVYNSKVPTISAVGHEIDFTLSDFAADMRAPTPSAAAELAVPDNSTKLIRLDEQKKAIYRSLCRMIDTKMTAVRFSETALRLKSPSARIEGNERDLAAVSDRISKRMHTLVDGKEREYISAASVIEALNPLAVLLRGYSITYKDGKAVRSADDVEPGDTLKIKLSEGSINATVNGNGS